MKIYATLFLGWVAEKNNYFEDLIKKKLCPELGFEHGAEQISKAQHREMALILKDNGLSCGVHLSYGNIAGGGNDKKYWQKSLDKLCREAEIASWYEADHMIAHPCFQPPSDSWAAGVAGELETDPDFSSPSLLPSPGWLERSARFWQKLMDVNEARLYLENTHDKSPEAIIELLKRIDKPQRAGMCFDVGHWFALAGGIDKHNLPQWLEHMGPYLSHLHLHDNTGASDMHLALGAGDIDLKEFFQLLCKSGRTPGFTLEAHGRKVLRESLEWIKKNRVCWGPFEALELIY